MEQLSGNQPEYTELSPELQISRHPLVIEAQRQLANVLAAAEAGLPIGHSKRLNIDAHWDDDIGAEVADAFTALSNARGVARKELGLPESDWGEFQA